MTNEQLTDVLDGLKWNQAISYNGYVVLRDADGYKILKEDYNVSTSIMKFKHQGNYVLAKTASDLINKSDLWPKNN